MVFANSFHSGSSFLDKMKAAKRCGDLRDSSASSRGRCIMSIPIPIIGMVAPNFGMGLAE